MACQLPKRETAWSWLQLLRRNKLLVIQLLLLSLQLLSRWQHHHDSSVQLVNVSADCRLQPCTDPLHSMTEGLVFTFLSTQTFWTYVDCHGIVASARRGWQGYVYQRAWSIFTLPPLLRYVCKFILSCKASIPPLYSTSSEGRRRIHTLPCCGHCYPIRKRQ